jgi:hypothetical protein
VTYAFDKHFTVSEARAQVSVLKRAFQELHDLAGHLRANAPRHKAAREASDGNGGSHADSGRYMDVNLRFQEIIKELSELGIQVKDVGRGLVDFPHIREGREVFLCWQLGEETVSYWHEIEAGFAGRRMLES